MNEHIMNARAFTAVDAWFACACRNLP